MTEEVFRVEEYMNLAQLPCDIAWKVGALQSSLRVGLLEQWRARRFVEIITKIEVSLQRAQKESRFSDATMPRLVLAKICGSVRSFHSTEAYDSPRTELTFADRQYTLRRLTSEHLKTYPRANDAGEFFCIAYNSEDFRLESLRDVAGYLDMYSSRVSVNRKTQDLVLTVYSI